MRKTVLSTTKAMTAEKRMTPRTAMARVRLLRTIQVMLRVTARPTVRTPRVMKVAMAPRRRVMFIACWKYSGVICQALRSTRYGAGRELMPQSRTRVKCGVIDRLNGAYVLAGEGQRI